MNCKIFLTHSRKHFSKKGQVSLFLVFLLLLGLLSLGWAVNIGMLVSAKISLQNAADAAAYSGASWQAQKLTEIGYLNYELKRNYKELLYKYYVLGQFGNKRWSKLQQMAPNSLSNSCSYSDLNTYVHGYNKQPGSPDFIGLNDSPPIACFYSDANSNHCRTSYIPGVPTTPNFSQIDQIANEITKKIQEYKSNDCDRSSAVNEMTVFSWILGIGEHLSFPTQIKDLKTGGQLSVTSFTPENNIGAIPRSLVYASKIESLVEFLNTPPVTGLSNRDLASLPPLKAERSIKAYLSAYKNVSEYMKENLALTEIAGPELKLSQESLDFDLLTLHFEDDGKNQGTCAGTVVQYPVALIINYYRSTPAEIVYGVKLETTVRPLLNPFGEVKLTAYSAAKPFGSRIGPGPINKNTYTWNGTFVSPTTGASLASVVPNYPICGPDDTRGFRTLSVMYHLAKYMDEFRTGNDVTKRTWDAILQLAKTPDLSEWGRYTIPNPMPTLFENEPDEMKSSSQEGSDLPSVAKFYQAPSGYVDQPSPMAQELKEPWYRFYAPINAQNLEDQIESFKNNLIEKITGGKSNIFKNQGVAIDLKDRLKRKIPTLLANLSSDDYQMAQVVSIENPFPKSLKVAQNVGIFWKPGPFQLSPKGPLNEDPNNGPWAWMTGWNDSLTQPIDPARYPAANGIGGNWAQGGNRREGYSVKLIPFDALYPSADLSGAGINQGEIQGKLFH